MWEEVNAEKKDTYSPHGTVTRELYRQAHAKETRGGGES